MFRALRNYWSKFALEQRAGAQEFKEETDTDRCERWRGVYLIRNITL